MASVWRAEDCPTVANFSRRDSASASFKAVMAWRAASWVFSDAEESLSWALTSLARSFNCQAPMRARAWALVAGFIF